MEGHRPSPRGPLTPLTGWGRSSVGRALALQSEDLPAITRQATLTRGLGRAYGDAALPAREGAAIAISTLANRLIAFDSEIGVLRAEAGLSLSDLNPFSLARGWFTPVTPGTQYVTLGGMVAADVHGKNHHRAGSFGQHVRSLRLRVGDGSIVDCSPEANAELFWATFGGMGLTGHILEVEFQLERIPSPWIWQEVERLPDLASVMTALRAAGEHWPYTVAWVDGFAPGRSFGRGVVIRGRWAEPEEAPSHGPRRRPRVTLPFELPNWALNPWTGRVGYAFKYGLTRPGAGIVHPEPFFYPLDAILGWNRAYGRRGFSQYQCVLPESASFDAMRRVFETLVELGTPSYLTVVKDLGRQGQGTLSFPCPGITFSLDIPVIADRTRRCVDRLNDQVASEGGRIYLAKEAMSRPDHFRAMEPRLGEWTRVREKWDPERRLRSALSVRLLGDEA